MAAELPADTGSAVRRRSLVRHGGAIIATATAILYLLIGFGVLSIVDEAAADAPPLLTFGLASGGMFALGAILLATVDRRVLWVLGACLQVGVIVMYVLVAPQRTPPFEVWGVLIKVLQALLLAILLYLGLTPVPRAAMAEGAHT